MVENSKPPGFAADPFIEAAVRPLAGNPERRLAAAALVSNMRGESAEGAEQVRRWNAVDAGRRPRWKPVLWVMLALATTLGMGGRWTDWRTTFQYMMWTLDPFGGPRTEALERVAAKLSPEKRFAVFGNDTTAITAAGREAVWLRSPGDPALYASYVSSYCSENNKCPADMLRTARKIDPDNAWFVYLAATDEGKAAVKRIPRKIARGAGKRSYETQTYEILDAGKFAKATDLIHEAGKLARCESYRAESNRFLTATLPMNHWSEYLESVTCLASFQQGAAVRMMKVADVIGAKASQAMTADQYAEVQADGEAVIRHLTESEVSTALEELINRMLVMSVSESLAAASGRLAIRTEAARWDRIVEAIRNENEARSKRVRSVAGTTTEVDRGTGWVFGVGLVGLARQVANPPPIRDTDLMPGRMLDHELFSEILSWVIWVFMGLTAGLFACYRFRVAPVVRDLAGRIESLLRPSDWAWIAGLGVIAPFLYVMAVNRLTPLGGRSFGVFGTFLVMPAAHFIGLVVLWLLATQMVVRARLAKVAGVFRFAPPHWTAWIALLSAVTFVPLIGWAVITGVPEAFIMEVVRKLVWYDVGAAGSCFWFRVSCALLAIPLMYLVFSSMMAIIGRPDGMLRQAVMARVLVPVCALAMLVCVLATFGFNAAERHWFQQDSPMKIEPGCAGWSPYEHSVALQMRKETRELLENP